MRICSRRERLRGTARREKARSRGAGGCSGHGRRPECVLRPALAQQSEGPRAPSLTHVHPWRSRSPPEAFGTAVVWAGNASAGVSGLVSTSPGRRGAQICTLLPCSLTFDGAAGGSQVAWLSARPRSGRAAGGESPRRVHTESTPSLTRRVQNRPGPVSNGTQKCGARKGQ